MAATYSNRGCDNRLSLHCLIYYLEHYPSDAGPIVADLEFSDANVQSWVIHKSMSRYFTKAFAPLYRLSLHCLIYYLEHYPSDAHIINHKPKHKMIEI